MKFILPTGTCGAISLAFLTLGACNGTDQTNANATNTIETASNVESIEDIDAIGAAHNDSSAALPTDDWTGRWTGPEGLFLDIQPAADGKAGHYALTVKDTLDRQGDYNGTADGATIRFVRDGKEVTLRPGKGDETGFKYLAEKQDCLIAVPGKEGYCR